MASLVKAKVWKREAENDWVDLKDDSLNLVHLVVNVRQDYVFMHAVVSGHHEN